MPAFLTNECQRQWVYTVHGARMEIPVYHAWYMHGICQCYAWKYLYHAWYMHGIQHGNICITHKIMHGTCMET